MADDLEPLRRLFLAVRDGSLTGCAYARILRDRVRAILSGLAEEAP
jgi:hypothetical protein